MSEFLAVPIFVTSFKVTSEGTSQTLGTAYLPDEVRGELQAHILEENKPFTLDYRIRRIDHENDLPHKSHLAIEWNLTWKPGDPNAPQMGMEATPETPKDRLGINPLNL